MKKFFVNEELVEEEEFDKMLDDAIQDRTEEGYDEWLDEIYEPIVIGYLEYSPSNVLQAVDPTAYNCGMDDYFEVVADEVRNELDASQDVYVANDHFEIKED